jgi:hypothetical protein
MKNKFGYRIIIWVAIFSLIPGVHDLSWAQGKKLLLFAQDRTFLPRIETILHDLRDYGTGDTIFSDITNLNTWSINRFELGQLD